MNRQPFRAINSTGGRETTSARQPAIRRLSRNNRIGVRKAMARATGGSSWPLTNRPRAASQNAAPNHATTPRSRIACLACIFSLQVWASAKDDLEHLLPIDFEGGRDHVVWPPL